MVGSEPGCPIARIFHNHSHRVSFMLPGICRRSQTRVEGLRRRTIGCENVAVSGKPELIFTLAEELTCFVAADIVVQTFLRVLIGVPLDPLLATEAATAAAAGGWIADQDIYDAFFGVG